MSRSLQEMPETRLINPCLETNREGVKRMLLTEYDEARTTELFKKEGLAKGYVKGYVEGYAKCLAKTHSEAYVKAFIEGYAEGYAEGVALMARLMSKLLSQGKSGDAERAANDEAFRNRLFEEYGIE